MTHFDEPPEPDFYEMAYLYGIAEGRKRCEAEIESIRAARDEALRVLRLVWDEYENLPDGGSICEHTRRQAQRVLKGGAQ